MVEHLPSLKQRIKRVIKRQILRRRLRFNIIAFSDKLTCWHSDSLVKASRNNCAKASGWVDSLKAWGGTNIQEAFCEALKLAFGVNAKEVVGIYLLTDGLPNELHSSVAEKILGAVTFTQPRIHAIQVGKPDP